MRIQFFLKIILINVILFMILIVIGSFLLKGYFYVLNYSDDSSLKNVNKEYNSNTIRATYPVYKNMPLKYAVNIFEDYAGPDTTYYPFLGWRRNVYVGKTVNVEKVLRTRKSINHKIDDSIWFFGGSTMWGTGSDDENTIPSHFAKLTGRGVLNLGESGYLSFQEYIHLSMLLAKGLTPRKVVFYDGVNESYYCNTNNKQFPSHSRVGKWTNYIYDYPRLKTKYEKLKAQQKNNELKDSIKNNIRRVYESLKAPYYYLYQLSFSKEVIGQNKLVRKADFNTSTPMSRYTQKNKYKDCDTSIEKIRKASRTTVNAWLMTYDLLKARGIEFNVFLQPTTQVSRNSINIDYLIDKEKQLIADQETSYIAQYEAIKKEWYVQCGKHNACESLHDISRIFNNLDEDLYIDAVHVGSRGNEIVAKAMMSLMKNE